MIDVQRPGYYISASRGPIPVGDMNSVHLTNALRKAIRERQKLAFEVRVPYDVPLYDLYLAHESLRALVDEAAKRELDVATEFFQQVLTS